jgi:NAD(P)-dependent dehydrogenase (short-subunit alcohol dehydrogenase family)
MRGEMARPLADVVVIVPGADGDVGRAVALAMGARGAHVVVVGERERALGEVVGEIANGGGSARHAVGGVAEGEAKARATWGRVDFVAAGKADAAGRDSPDAFAEAMADALVDLLARKAGENGGAIT